MLWPKHQYELIDFGRGRKLERFGDLVIDRPSPAAESAEPALPVEWSHADLRIGNSPAVDVQASSNWQVQFAAVCFQLRVTPFGHVGLFPEHAINWRWLLNHYGADGSVESDFTTQADTSAPVASRRLLNLFAYTGGASLVMAQAGWQVVHIDSSAPTVAWARHNALVSGLEAAPIRWLVEDARRFAAREVRRGHRYDAIVLDPPTYGHGPQGKAWQIASDLPELLSLCCQLLNEHGTLILSGHSEPPASSLSEIELMRSQLGHANLLGNKSRLALLDRSERRLDFGWNIVSYCGV